MATQSKKERSKKLFEDLKTFAEVLALLRSNYVENVGNQQLVRGAIRGMLQTLDPHTTFLPPKEFRESQIETQGKFGGLGIEITMRNGVLLIISPIDDTPAQRSGLKAGDKIVSVDSQVTKGMTLSKAVQKLRGKPGTKVVVEIMRSGWKKSRKFTLVREVIRVRSVSYRKLEKGMGYIRISQFNQDTSRDVKKGLKVLGASSLKGLVLDLRNNPGGLLSAAVAVTDAFVDEASLLVYTKGRVPEQNMRFHSKGPTMGSNIPMVVLVDGGSASASEIVAGALQDLGRAVIAGTQTFGKGSVQTVLPLSDGSGLRMTTGLYYTPKGRQIQGRGITPDIIMGPMVQSKNRERRRLRERDLKGSLKGKDDPESTPGVARSGARERKPFKKTGDSQLDRAVELLRGWDILRQRLGKEAKAS
jgi:carboxyl-terminal processing protease